MGQFLLLPLQAIMKTQLINLLKSQLGPFFDFVDFELDESLSKGAKNVKYRSTGTNRHKQQTDGSLVDFAKQRLVELEELNRESENELVSLLVMKNIEEATRRPKDTNGFENVAFDPMHMFDVQ